MRPDVFQSLSRDFLFSAPLAEERLAGGVDDPVARGSFLLPVYYTCTSLFFV